MKVFPVLDLRDGVCVRAVAGNRDAYRPVKMRGLPSPSPIDTAQWYRDRFGLNELYVADLSAILGGTPSWDAYRELEHHGFQLWLDAGISSLDAWRRHFAASGGRLRTLIAALESLSTPCEFVSLAQAIALDRGGFSLDLRLGGLWTNVPEWVDWKPQQLLEMIVHAGIRRVIILDVGAVGVEAGPTVLELCRHCRRSYPDVELISGGGVRGIDDLRQLRDAGCTAALVATALQAERITRTELESL
ncbi:MAG: HisA/HisF-related TIM barrel protein [Planctomycetota bacterium]